MRAYAWRVRLSTSMLLILIASLIFSLGLKVREVHQLHVALAQAESRASKAEAEAEWAHANALWSEDAGKNTWGLVWKQQNGFQKWVDHVRAENLDGDRVEPSVRRP
jgi:hypothetical protein